MIAFLSGKTQIKDDSGIVFKATVHQFGSVKRGSNVEYVFTFINKGKTPVIINKAKVFCSCVVSNWTKEPVLPNDSGKINVKYYAREIGTFSKTIKVFTNKNDESIDLRIQGVVPAVSNKN